MREELADLLLLAHVGELLPSRTACRHGMLCPSSSEHASEVTMDLAFEWDEAKATSNLQEHGISFDEAQTVFGDPNSITIPNHDI
jgi:hypothetical protein